MKDFEWLRKIFSLKNIFIFWISYSIFIITYLTGIHDFLGKYYLKFDIYITICCICFICFILSLAIKKKLLKIFFLITVITCVLFTYPEFQIICSKEKLGQDFFNEYFERFNKMYDYTCMSDKTYMFENIFELKNQFVPKEKLDEKMYFVSDRKLKVFDFVNQGLSSQEQTHMWTDGEIVRIPVYVDKNVVSGEIELEIFAHNKEFFYYINSWNIQKRYCGEVMKIQIPFKKNKGEELIFIKFIIPEANYIYDENGNIKDKRKLGLKLFSMELINEEVSV